MREGERVEKEGETWTRADVGIGEGWKRTKGTGAGKVVEVPGVGEKQKEGGEKWRGERKGEVGEREGEEMGGDGGVWGKGW